MPTDNDAQQQDVDFLDAMQDLLNMNKEQVDDLLEKLDADQLQELTDAVAKHDSEAAKQVVSQAHTDEEINALFRGKNLKTNDSGERKTHSSDQYSIGDNVEVDVVGSDGKMHKVSATVANPNGPEGTDSIVVKIKGKTTVVQKTNIRLEETMVGMVGMPDLGRIQQLAGLRSPRLDTQTIMPQIDVQAEIEPLPDCDPAPDDPLANAMSAFDTLEACLPNIQLADLKAVRERLTALQTSLNENYRFGRARKI